MKNVIKGFTAVAGTALALAAAGNVAYANVNSEAVVSFERFDGGRSNARIVEEQSALDLNFGHRQIRPEEVFNSLWLSEQNGGRHITVEDLSGNTGGWELRVSQTPFTNIETGHQLSTQLSFNSESDWWWDEETGNEYHRPALASDTGNAWHDSGFSIGPWWGSQRVMWGTYGTHTLNWSHISLWVSSGQNIQDGNYSSTLTWSVSINPGWDDIDFGGESGWDSEGDWESDNEE